MFGQTLRPDLLLEADREVLGQEYEVRTVDLSTGVVDGDVDVLVVIAPQSFDDKALYAIDQYLMRGGAVVVAAGNMGITYDPYSGGLGSRQLLAVSRSCCHYGITVENRW